MPSHTLYRIISLENFIALLELNEEVYKLPSEWKDSFEGCALQFIDKKDNRRRFIEVLAKQYQGNEHFIDAIVDNYVKAEIVRFCCYAQCWSIKRESDALWNKFGIGNHAIQITSNTNIISKNLNALNQPYKMDKVQYDIDKKDEPYNFMRFYQKGMDFKEQLFHKRPAFRDEGEYRIIITRNDYDSLFNNQLNKYRQELEKQYNSGNTLTVESIIETINEVNDRHNIKTDTTLKIHIENVSKYISRVRVHPDAEPWYVDLVKRLCLKNRVRFDEQSPLYKEL